MARHGIHGLVVRSTPHHQGVCHRHHRWLLGGDQHHLDALPEILHADLRHRRLVRCSTAPFIALDYQCARTITANWFRSSEPLALQQRWTRRLDAIAEDAYGDPHRPTEDRIELATYPETVALTGLFASPHWRERKDLHAEAARRLAVDAQDLPADLTSHGLVASDS
ncbi:hypothetical protein ACIOGZ_29270 [Kitasatospora sp. NPDC088160]